MDKLDLSAQAVKATIIAADKAGTGIPLSVVEGSKLLSAAEVKRNIMQDFKTSVRQMESLRTGGKDKRCIDLSISDYVNKRFGFSSLDSFYGAIDVDPSSATIDSLASMGDFNEGFRWLVPEVIREAVRLGLRRNPIYPSLIAGEESVSQPTVTMPSVNMSDATPKKVNEAETISTGFVSFNEKTVKLQKLGTGLKISDEVQKYVSLNVLSLYLQDAGVKLGLGLDTLAVNTLINGDGSPNSSAPVVGVDDTGNGITYKDILRAWLKLGRLGRTPSSLISNEEPALNILQLAEFKGANYNNKKQNINIKTPIPQNQDYFVHGGMPELNHLGFVDRTASLIKLNSEALKVESERIAERQITGTYITLTTGYAKLFRDAFLIMDGNSTLVDLPYPSYMDVNVAENVLFM